MLLANVTTRQILFLVLILLKNVIRFIEYRLRLDFKF